MPQSEAFSQGNRPSLTRVSRDDVRPESKRPKLESHGTDRAAPVHYLDTLSKVWLTKEALREHDRRVRSVKATSEGRWASRGHRPLTRRLRIDLSKIRSSSTPASEFLKQCSPESLREVKFLARHGGPDLLDLRGHLEPTHPCPDKISSTHSSHPPKHSKRRSESTSPTNPTPASTEITQSTNSRDAYNPNFEQRLVNNGIYRDVFEYSDGRTLPVPDNRDEIEQMLAQRRPSLTPSAISEGEFKEFRRVEHQTFRGTRTAKDMVLMIQGKIRDNGYVDGGILLDNLADIMRGSSYKAKPNIYYGASPSQVDIRVRDSLDSHITPSKTTTGPLAPNFFVVVRDPVIASGAVEPQACFAGATGARAMHSLLTYGEKEPTYDNRAYTLSATYYDGLLRLYAHHLGQPNGPCTDPEYYMTQLNAWTTTGNRKSLLEAMTAFRNAEDWTESQRNVAIAHANDVVNASMTGEPTTTKTT